MHYQQPPSSSYPPHYSQNTQHSNNNDSMSLGMVLGRLEQGQSQMVYLGHVKLDVLNQILNRLEDNARIMQQQASQPPPTQPPPPAEKMTWKDWAQIAIAIIVVLGAITGRLAPKEAIGLIGKPLGF